MEEVLTVKVIALKSFSTGTISMFKGEIREMDADTAETLIDNNLVEVYKESDLPKVTDADAGKVLTVNNSGVWVAQNPSSGGGVLFVNVSVVQDGNNIIYTADKTAREIINAMPLVYSHDIEESGGSVNHYYNILFSGWDLTDGEYNFNDELDDVTLKASTLDDYPTCTETGK